MYGAGDVALETALALCGQPGTVVTLRFRGEVIDRAIMRNRDKVEQAAARGKLRIHAGIHRAVEIRKEGFEPETVESQAVLDNDVVFVCFRAEPPPDRLRNAGMVR